LRFSVSVSPFDGVPLRRKRARTLVLSGAGLRAFPTQIHGFLSRDPIRAAASLAMTVCLLLSPESAWPQDAKTTEYRAKATFLANFPYFVEWPGEAFPSVEAPLLICVDGEFSFGTWLAQTTGTVSLHGRRIEIRWVRKEEDELRACHILFVSRSEVKRYGIVLGLVRGASTLTVGETPDFLANGGTVSFSLQQGALQFEVNLGAADEAHLKISSKMLALAKHVLNPTKAAQN
jgi:uncharacterized protein DUF4154